MSNVIQIKSGSLPPPNGTLENFELGYVTNDGCLYIGVNEETVPVKVQAAESLVSNWGAFYIEEDVFLLEYGQPVLEFLYGNFLRITAPVNGSGEILLSEETIELIDPGAGRAAIKITPGFTKIIDNQNNDRLVVGWNGTTTIMNQQYGGITIANHYIELVDGWGGGIALESGNLRFNYNGNTYFNDVLCDIPAMQEKIGPLEYVYSNYSLNTSSMTIPTGPGREVFLVISHQAGAITRFRTAYIVFCASYATGTFSGSAILIASATTTPSITVSQQSTDGLGEMVINKDGAGTAAITVIRLAL